jgi:hypothetical protein
VKSGAKSAANFNAGVFAALRRLVKKGLVMKFAEGEWLAATQEGTLSLIVSD